MAVNDVDYSRTQAIMARAPEFSSHQSRPSFVASGYVPQNETVHRAFNLIGAIFLSIAVFPIFAIVTILLFFTQGWRIFYGGPRIGRNRKLFSIYKFRTLDSEKAAAITKSGVLPKGSGIETPLGGFLRASRLDELPQLINVLTGDMNLVGPRPVRPEIATIYEQEIPNYGVRFSVKPGLLGHTQALMSHGTAKTIRARYNYAACRTPVNYRHELGIVMLVGICVLRQTAEQIAKIIRQKLHWEPDNLAGLNVKFIADDQRSWNVVSADPERLVLINHEVPAAGSQDTAITGQLNITLSDGQQRRARVRLDAPSSERNGLENATEYRYSPLTDFGFHVISRYLNHEVVVPHRSFNLVGSLRRRLLSRQMVI